MFRFVASVFQTVVAAMTAGSFAIQLVLLFGGFVISKRKSIYSFSNLILESSDQPVKLMVIIGCSLNASVVEVGLLDFSCYIWGDRALFE